MRDGVLFVERANELAVWRLIKGVIPVVIVKARMNNPTLCHALDPKPSEPSMARLNPS